jgi:hypothetical protein
VQAKRLSLTSLDAPWVRTAQRTQRVPLCGGQDCHRKFGAGGVRSKNGCGQVRPRTRHPSTMPIARIISHGLSRVEPSGALPTAYLP